MYHCNFNCNCRKILRSSRDKGEWDLVIGINMWLCEICTKSVTVQNVNKSIGANQSIYVKYIGCFDEYLLLSIYLYSWSDEY